MTTYYGVDVEAENNKDSEIHHTTDRPLPVVMKQMTTYYAVVFETETNIDSER